MPVICQAFVENAWKKELCANCFKSVEEHSRGGTSSSSHRALSGQDSLTELEQGAGRYHSQVAGAGHPRYARQVTHPAVLSAALMLKAIKTQR